MGQLTDKIMLVVQYGLILLLLLGLAGPYLNPEHFTISAFSSLVFPYVFVGLIVSGLYGLLRRNYGFLPTILALLLSTIGILKSFAFNPFNTQGDGDHSLSLMSYNVQGFGRYQSDAVVDQYLELFKSEQPDLLCLQEFYAREEATENNLSQVKAAGTFASKYCNTAGYEGKGNFFGLVIFSKYPIINQGYIYFEGKQANGCIYVDVVRKNDTIRVYNGHLQSTHLFKNSRLDQSEEDNPIFTNFGNKIKRLNKGFIKRAGQSRKIAKAIKKSPYPVILCGDMNDTPLSYTYEILTQELEDAFLSSGNGIGSTYAERLRFLRIDYIFHDENLSSSNFQALDSSWSDHYPIRCKLNVTQQD